MSDLPQTYDLEAYHGDTWSQTFTFKVGATPYDLTGATVRSWVTPGPPPNGYTALTAVIGTPATNGQVTISLNPVNIEVGSYRYDIEVTKAGAVTTWVEGELTVNPEVTA